MNEVVNYKYEISLIDLVNTLEVIGGSLNNTDFSNHCITISMLNKIS